MKKALLIIGIVLGSIHLTVSQTNNSGSISGEKEIHCFDEEEYEGILFLYYEVNSLETQVIELKRILTLKDSALTMCVEDYTYMEETLSMVSDSLGSYKDKTKQISEDMKEADIRHQRTKKVAIISSIGFFIMTIIAIAT